MSNSLTEDSACFVSVVIPTIGRPELRKAVTSVLAQTAHLHEVIVAADTADPLDLPDDSRVHVIRTGPRAGGNVARMAGIKAASAPIIALLDDDDLWYPHKLQHQLEALRRSSLHEYRWLSATYVREANGRVWPERRINADEDLPSYLFRKTKLRGGQGALHTSTLLFPKQLVMRHPFDESLRFHQDTDWLVRLSREVPDIGVVQLDEPLVELGKGAGSVSRGIQPERSLEWATNAMAMSSRRARGDFLLTVTYFQALRHRNLRAAARIVWTAVTWGRPTWYGTLSIITIPIKLVAARDRL